MSKFIEVISKGVKYSINVSQIILVEEDKHKSVIVHFTPAKDLICIHSDMSYEEVMKLIRE
jgi:hypothetical protein